MIAADIVFTNPALWAGAFALFVPLVIHLLTRHTARSLAFPSLRFLEKARASQSRLFRLRHLIMFILRTLAILLLLLAFLEPVMHSPALKPAAKRNLPSAAVIVIDASASMDYRLPGSTLFAKAKAAALNIVRSFDRDDRGDLILAGARATASFTEPSSNIPQLREDISKAEVTFERANMNAVMAEAVKQLAKQNDCVKELYFVSDFQRSNWASVDLGRVPPDIKTVFVPIPRDEEANVFVSDIALQPPFPIVQEQVEILCRIANTGDTGVRVPVELRLGQDTILRREVSVGANATATESFRFRPSRAGAIEGTVEIPADTFPVDNTKYFVMPVADRMSVLIVSDEPPRGGSGRALLMKAVDPFEHHSESLFRVRSVGTESLGALSAAIDHAIVISAAKPFEYAALDKLLHYLHDGGGVLVFLTSDADRHNLLALETRSKGSLTLPFHPGVTRRRSDHDAQPSFTLQQADFDHPVFRKFRDVADLSQVRFFARYETERVHDEGQILALYGDGTIAMASRQYGAGVLLVCNFSAALADSDLGRHVLFVPLIHEMIKGTRPLRSRQPEFAVGYPCSTTVKRWGDNQQARFTSPDSDDVSVLFDAKHDEVSVVFPETHRPGFYRILADGALLGSVAVNVDKLESNLAVLSTRQIARTLKNPASGFRAGRDGSLANFARLREGTPLWPYLLLGVLACLACEQILWITWKQ